MSNIRAIVELLADFDCIDRMEARIGPWTVSIGEWNGKKEVTFTKDIEEEPLPIPEPLPIDDEEGVVDDLPFA